MSRNEMMTTAVGWAATKPKEITVGSEVPFTSFRLASTPRRFDSRQGCWVDGHTEWMTVKVFRDHAINVAGSIGKGDAVIAYGRLHTEEWTSEGIVRSGLVLDATAVGHDLTKGRATFVRTRRVPAAGDAPTEAVVVPAAEVDPWAITPADLLDVAGDGSSAGPDDGAEDGEDTAAEVEVAATP